MKLVAFAVRTSAMSSSTQRAARPPLMYPMRLIPLTIVWSWPWLGCIFRSSGWAFPVGSSPTGRS